MSATTPRDILRRQQARELGHDYAQGSSVYGIIAQCLCPDHLWIKIGRSNNPQDRERRLNNIVKARIRGRELDPGPMSLAYQYPPIECLQHHPLKLRWTMPGHLQTERLTRNLIAHDADTRQVRGEWLELPTGHDRHWIDPDLTAALHAQDVDAYLRHRRDRDSVETYLTSVFSEFGGGPA